MERHAGRHEEFGAPPWTAVLAALALTVAVASPLLHHDAAPHAQPPAPRIAAQIAHGATP